MTDHDAPTGAAFVYGTMILAGVVLGLLVAGILMLDGVPWSTCWWMVPAGGVAAFAFAAFAMAIADPGEPR